MIHSKNILAIIPARGGSKGLPKKNIRELLGKPLLGWPISAALGSKYVDQIIVSTDSQEFARIAEKEGAFVPFLRPDELSSDITPTFFVLRHAIEYFKEQGKNFVFTLLLEPTSPLTESKDIDNAIELLNKNSTIADSIIGIAKAESSHPEFNVTLTKNHLIKPYLDDNLKHKRRQDIQDIYFFEGSLYLSKTETLLKEKGFYHDKTMGYVVPKWKSFEIDDLIDWYCVEAIMRNKMEFITDE